MGETEADQRDVGRDVRRGVGRAQAREVATLPTGDGEVRVVAVHDAATGTCASAAAGAALDAALADGLLGLGDRFVATAQGADLPALAREAAARGLRSVLVTSERSGATRVAVARAYGADVRVDPSADGDEALDVMAGRLSVETSAPLVRLDPTGGHRQLAGDDVARAVELLVPDDATVFVPAAEPAVAQALTRGLGDDRVRSVAGLGAAARGTDGESPSVFPGCAPRPGPGSRSATRVPDGEIAAAAGRLARECGVLTTAAGAAAVAAALRDPGGGVRVALLTERGEHELDTLHDPHWLRRHGLLRPDGRLSAADLLEQQHGEPPALVYLGPDSLLGEAISIMQELEVSQIPIVDGDEVVGTLRDDQIIDLLLHAPEQRHEPVRQVMDDPLPRLPGEATLDDVQAAILAGAPAVLIQLPDARLGILTKYDLIHGLSLS